MHEIVILSGKGGTGKTSLTAAFAHMAGDHVICDLDVDAPDLHLLLQPETERTESFISGNEAVIAPDRCEDCGLCAELCRFGAVRRVDDQWTIDPLRCEGCKVCVALCPAEAIDFPDRDCGRWYLSRTRFGTMVHAQLFPGEENSGRLVALLRQQAKALAEKGAGRILSDGPPGIGCPVISALSGVSLAVIVTEPTPSGRHDLERVIELCGHFKVPAGVIINKFDLNPEQTAKIETFCAERGLPVIERFPHDPAVTEAMVRGLVITEYADNGFSEKVRNAWNFIEDRAAQKRG